MPGVVDGGIVGHAVVEAGVYGAEPAAAEDADCLGVAFSWVAGVLVEVGGPGARSTCVVMSVVRICGLIRLAALGAALIRSSGSAPLLPPV